MMLLLNLSDRCMSDEVADEAQEYYEHPLSPTGGDPRDQIAAALDALGLTAADVKMVMIPDWPLGAAAVGQVFPHAKLYY